jgi:hypothetical protein
MYHATQQSIKKYVDDNASFDASLYMTSANVIDNYMKSDNSIGRFYPSTLGKGVSSQVLANTLHSANSSLHTFSVDNYMTSTNIIENYMKSDNSIGRFYPSTLGKGVSGNVKTLIDWYNASSQKYSLSSQNAMQEIQDGVTNWVSADFTNSGLLWDGTDWVAKASGAGGGTLNGLTDTTLTSPVSGEILVYKQNNARWENELPPMTFSVANARLLSGQNLNVTRYSSNLSTYVWQACAANSGGASVSGLQIELLRNATSIGIWVCDDASFGVLIMIIDYPKGAKSNYEKYYVCYNLQELLRLRFNASGTAYRNEQITESQWNDFKSDWYNPKINLVTDELLNFREMARNANWSVALDDVFVGGEIVYPGGVNDDFKKFAFCNGVYKLLSDEYNTYHQNYLNEVITETQWNNYVRDWFEPNDTLIVDTIYNWKSNSKAYSWNINLDDIFVE